jgi:hypothetical protein
MNEGKSMQINEELLFTIMVDRELKNGNTGRTKHFSQAIKEKKGWAKALKVSDVIIPTGIVLPLPAFIEEVLGGKTVQQRVGLVVNRVLGKRQRFWDADSALRGAKELIDATVDTGLLEDDNMKHVAWCVGSQDDTRKEEGPFVELLFYGAENNG